MAQDVTYESDKSQNYANTTIFINSTDSEELPNNNNGPVNLNVFACSNEILNDIYFCEWKKINDIDIEKYRLLCNGKICTKQIPHLHCILCNEEDFPTKHFLYRHLKQANFNKAHCVKFENNACLPCRNKNHTMSKLKRKISHFNCPVCKKTVRQKGSFQKHLPIHTDKITKNTNFNVNAISNTKNQTHIKSLKEHLPSQFEDQKIGLLHQSTVEENLLDEYQKIKRNYIPKVKCTECGLTLQKNNLKRHFRSKYQTLQCMPSAVCVDKALGIYMVPKSKSGVLRPIYVQKCFRNPGQCKLFCENNFCMDFIGICGKSDLGYGM